MLADADAQGRVDWGIVTVDSTSSRARQHAVGAPLQGLTFGQALDLLHHLVATRTCTCPTCRQPAGRAYDAT